MRRTTGTNRVTDKFGSGKDGHRDRVMDGLVIVEHGTTWEADMADSVQEELCNAIEDDGDTLDEDDKAQLSTVIQRRAKGAASATDNAIARFDSTTGKVIQNSGVQIDDSANIVYASPKVRSIVIPSSAFVPTSSADVVVRSTDGSYSQSATNSAHFLADVSAYLNDRCTITAYGVYVTKGAARAGGNKMAIKLWRNPYPSSAVQLGSGDVDNGSSGPELLDETLGTPHAVDRAANAYSLDVKVGHDAATYPDAIVYGFVTVSEAGPGLGT